MSLCRADILSMLSLGVLEKLHGLLWEIKNETEKMPAQEIQNEN